jgi:hypothetical protein
VPLGVNTYDWVFVAVCEKSLFVASLEAKEPQEFVLSFPSAISKHVFPENAPAPTGYVIVVVATQAVMGVLFQVADSVPI